METKYWSMNERHINKLNEARQLLKQGEVVAFPTETVYGLGADARNESAIQKVFIAKGRPTDNPLIVHVASIKQLKQLAKNIRSYVYQLIERFSPGPITYVLESNGTVAPSVTGGLKTVGIRLPDHPVALALLKACDFPLAAPSANISGRPSPTRAEHVIDDLDGHIAGIIDGGAASEGIESTVVDCTTTIPTILRLGAITPEDIKQVVGDVIVMATDVSSTPKSPGMKYKHYAPEVPLLLFIDYDESDIVAFIKHKQEAGQRVGVLSVGERLQSVEGVRSVELGHDNKERALNLYRVLRSFKKVDVDIIVCFMNKRNHVSLAIMDRLKRAATDVY